MYGVEKASESFVETGRKLGFDEHESQKAFTIAYGKQKEFFNKATCLGEKALAEARRAEKPVIAILGRPYNAFTTDANMDIPKNIQQTAIRLFLLIFSLSPMRKYIRTCTGITVNRT